LNYSLKNNTIPHKLQIAGNEKTAEEFKSLLTENMGGMFKNMNVDEKAKFMKEQGYTLKDASQEKISSATLKGVS
jgi:hypothetical protein